MKKFINGVNGVETEMMLGMGKAYPDKIKMLDCGGVFVRKNKKDTARLP